MSITRRHFIGGSAAFLGAGLLGNLAFRMHDSRPNILLIICDDLRPDLGGADAPHIRAIGPVHTARCSYPLCAPSRASMLTGLPVDAHGVVNNHTPLPTDLLTLPQHLAAHGYHTASVGKVEHSKADDAGWHHRVWMAGGTCHADHTRFTSRAFEAFDVPDDTYRDWHTATAAHRLVHSMPEPWFCAVGFVSTHLPFCAPARYWNLAESVPTDGIGAALHPLLQRYDNLDARMDGRTGRMMVRGYRAAVRYMDVQIGRLLEDAPQNTRILLVGDHGFALGEGGAWGKHGPAARALTWDCPLVGADLPNLTGLFDQVCHLTSVSPIARRAAAG